MANFKKLAIISSSVLATAMLTAFGVACGEEVCNHEFELKHDTEKHWYACKNDGCTLKVGEDEHIWNEGEETKAPEVGVKGEYTYTCQVCGVTETDEVPALEANPLIVAEGTVTTTNFNWYNQTITLEAGNYVVITGNEGITCDPITVYEAGETEIVFSVFDMTGDYGAEITFNYTVKKVPSITPDISNMEGEVEIVSYAGVEVSVVVPTAGRYKINSDNAYFAMDQYGSGESSYVITTTEDEEEVVFYVKATDESEENDEE